jgi:hypothetical protein
MKKLIYMMGLAAVLASCSTDEYEEWANPQSNAAETAKTVTFSAIAANAIDYNKVTADSIQLFTPTITTADSVTSVVYTATVYDAAKSGNVKLTADKRGYVSAKDLKSAIENLYGKSDDVHKVPTTVTGTIKLASNVGFIKTASLTNTINLVTPAYGEYFYEIGNESEWKTIHALYGPNVDGKYEGWYYLNGEFKFKPNADNWNNDYEYNGEGKIADNGGSNCPDPGAGFYCINVDLSEGTYKLTKVTSLSIIGTVKGNWDTDVDLTYNATDGAWEYTGALNAGEFKIRMNHAWTTSWGGKSSATDYSNLTYSNGNNLKVEESGTYKVKFYLTYEGNNKIVITK